MPARNAIFAGSLDKRLGFLGTSGSGKTYGAGTLVEEVLAKGWRTVIGLIDYPGAGMVAANPVLFP